MDNNKMPISMAMNEAKKQIAEAITNTQLPPILLHYIVKDLLSEIDILAEGKLKQDIDNYNKQTAQTNE